MMSPREREAILELAARAEQELTRRRAARDFATFVQYLQPDYVMEWVHREICDLLQQFLADQAAGKGPRLMINLAPRHGKSELVSRKFPAFAFGLNPDLQIIACSYGASLAQDMSRDVQRNMDSDRYREVFPDVWLKGSRDGGVKRTADQFDIVGTRGKYTGAGVGGAITGKGADILIIDDVFKSRAEAESPTVRKSVIDWYRGTAYTRLSPQSGVLIIMTRWHTDDLAGFLFRQQRDDEMADRWQVVSYPAVAVRDEPRRLKGEALSPRRFPLERLRTIRANIGNYDFEAQYQQNPYIPGGNLFRSEWFHRYTELPKLKYRIIVCDTALKTREANDFSVAGVFGLAEAGDIYVLDWLRGKWPSYELKTRLRDLWYKHAGDRDRNRGTLRYLAVEDKASGTDVLQTLGHENRIPLKALEPQADKVTRALDAIPYIESGYVYLPEAAPWVADLLGELEAFQADMGHAHDDQVDVLVYAVTELRIRAGGISFNAANLRRRRR